MQNLPFPRLNLGCGHNKIEGCINLDIEPSVNPDIVHDFKTPLPYPDNSIEEIFFFHVIEHIEDTLHDFILEEIYRVLVPGGTVYISYPEFKECAANYMSNYKGMRYYWKQTLYGRQMHKGDYHVSLMDTPRFIFLLQQIGFTNVQSKPEPSEPWNTVVRAEKGKKVPGYEELLRNTVFGN
jgi:SAM-dependent methyltransferase